MAMTFNSSRSEGLDMKFGKQGCLGAILAVVVLAAVGCGKATQSGPEIVVYKSPTCSCCSKWVSHLQDSGFRVTVHQMSDVDSMRQQYGVPAALAACHTARVGGYTIEGHVPAAAIERLLKEHPAIAGLAVPGMPVGSPGMEQGTRRVAYEVLAFDAQGHSSVYEAHPATP